MLPAFRPHALALMLALPVSALSAEVVWRSFPQIPVADDGLPVFVDLDGDGTNEIVFGSQNLASPGSPTYSLSVLSQVDGGGFELLISIPLPATLFSLVPVRRPGHADSVLVTVGYSGPTRLMEFTGLELQQLRDLVVPDLTRLSAVADIDADGALDILADTSASWGFGPPLILSYATGSVIWQGPEPTQEAIAAQLDADPAMEIISRGVVGRIYDGATGLQEWAWPSGFGQSMVAGHFEADPLVPGFATQGNSATAIFRASPYSPLRELTGVAYPMTAFDADGDERDELYATRSIAADFVRVSPQDGSIQPLFAPIAFAGSPRLGRLQPNGPTVAVLASLEANYFQPGAMTVFDLDSEQVRYSAVYAKAPWWPSAFARPQPSGPLLAAGLIGRFRASPAQYQIALDLRDFGSGALVATRPNLFPQGSSEQGAGLMAADIDGVPGDEIVVLRLGSYSSVAALLDGVTLQDRWRVSGVGTPLENVAVRGWALVDRNQDGVQDVVLATSGNFSNGIRLVVLSGVDGTVLWQSVTISHPNLTPFVGLVAGAIDAQPGDEIVLAVADGIYAFDAQTGLSTWIVKGSGQPFSDVIHWGSGSGCRIGAVDRGQLLHLLSCTDRQPLGVVTLPPGSERVAPLDPEGSVLAAAVAGDLLVARNGGPFQAELPGLGAMLTVNWPWAVRSAPDSIAVLLGSTLQVLRADLAGDRLFASGFESLP